MTISTTTTIKTSLTRLINSPSQPPEKHWSQYKQPVKLVTLATTKSHCNTTYYPTALSPDAHAILIQLPAPLYIVAFTGFGRSGKSFVSSQIAAFLTEDSDVKFESAPGNFPCTHGIDMMVFKHPLKEGHFIFLDCEGGGNHNQTAFPFVIGLAARLASKLFVFERGCFTTNGLESVLQIVNMGHATNQQQQQKLDITSSLVLCENMSINLSIPTEKLVADLLTESPDGDENTNQIRRLVTKQFSVEFAKIPYSTLTDHEDSCMELASVLADTVNAFQVGGVAVDGGLVVGMIKELIGQIKEDGAGKYNVVSATQTLVHSMTQTAFKNLWTSFIRKTHQHKIHPTQITGRTHLRTILRQLEGLSNETLCELESFTTSLHPPLSVRAEWTVKYNQLVTDLVCAHKRKSRGLEMMGVWSERVNGVICEGIRVGVGTVGHMVRFARFGGGLVLMSQWWVWKRSFNVATGFALGYLLPSKCV